MESDRNRIIDIVVELSLFLLYLLNLLYFQANILNYLDSDFSKEHSRNNFVIKHTNVFRVAWNEIYKITCRNSV